MLGAVKVETAPYPSQANGMAERGIRAFTEMPKMVVNERDDDWDENIDAVRFAFNTTFSTSVGESPFFLLFGTDPNLPIDYILGAEQPQHDKLETYNKKLVQRLLLAWKAAEAEHAKPRDERGKRHEKRRGGRFSSYKPGDLVYVYSELREKGLSRKLAQRWSGPYRVVGDEMPGVSIVQPADWRAAKNMRVHHTRLKVFTTRGAHLAAAPRYHPGQVPEDLAIVPSAKGVSRRVE